MGKRVKPTRYLVKEDGKIFLSKVAPESLEFDRQAIQVSLPHMRGQPAEIYSIAGILADDFELEL